MKSFSVGYGHESAVLSPSQPSERCKCEHHAEILLSCATLVSESTCQGCILGIPLCPVSRTSHRILKVNISSRTVGARKLGKRRVQQFDFNRDETTSLY